MGHEKRAQWLIRAWVVCGVLLVVSIGKRGVLGVPVVWIDALLHEAVEGGIWPIFYIGHQPMLERIEVDVIHMGVEVFLVANFVIPEAPLPNRPLPAPGTRLAAPLRTRDRHREPAFDQPPPQ